MIDNDDDDEDIDMANSASMSIQNTSEHCLPFVLRRIRAHQQFYSHHLCAPPFFLGVNGIQGAGKTTLVSALRDILSKSPYDFPTLVLSIDDLYLSHEDQQKLASSDPRNPLIQHRGQPSTHDLALGESVFSSLRQNKTTRIPRYDKSAFNGQGDRVDDAEWDVVNGDGQERIKLVIFEGWCVGFRPLAQTELEIKWRTAVEAKETGKYTGRLGYARLQDVVRINDVLEKYHVFTDQLDALLHLDAEDTRYVYQWRLEQEHALRSAKGSGMSDDEVSRFVDGYYPAYELFTDALQTGLFLPEEGRQLRIVVGKDRRVKSVVRI